MRYDSKSRAFFELGGCVISSIITTSALIVIIGWYGFLMLLLNVFNKKAARTLADYIVKNVPTILFALLSTYKKFKICEDKSLYRQLPEKFLVASNHQSLLDIPLFMHYFNSFPLRFVAKEELGKNVPLVSRVIRIQEHALIPRAGSPVRVMSILDDFARRVSRDKLIPVIFPEGTRSKDGNLLTFYPAGFRRLLDQAPLPVVVCAVDGGYKLGNLKKIFTQLHRGTYKVSIVGVFDAPHTKQEQINILEEGKKLIDFQLKKWRTE